MSDGISRIARAQQADGLHSPCLSPVLGVVAGSASAREPVTNSMHRGVYGFFGPSNRDYMLHKADCSDAPQPAPDVTAERAVEANFQDFIQATVDNGMLGEVAEQSFDLD